MIKIERESRILEIVNDIGIASISDLTERLGSVSAVTVRRDVARLAERGALRRSHGGVARIETAADHAKDGATGIDPAIEDADAIVLPPLEGRGAETLRLMARRRAIPFLAESAPQTGGVYLGADNIAAGRDLGRVAAQALAQTPVAKILIVSHESLSNTRARCDGFLAGFQEAFAGEVQHWRVDGRGVFKYALRASLDALQAHPDINVLFGVNDHSILAAIEAAGRLGLDEVRAFSVGGEGGALFDALVTGEKLVACSALFPEMVGFRAVEVLAEALAGEAMPVQTQTPHAVITKDNINQYYRRGDTGWAFAPGPEMAVGAGDKHSPNAPKRRPPRRGRIGFVPHYPAHDWYRNMQKAMQQRADELGLELIVATPQTGIAREIRSIRRMIARAAAATVAPGDTILINQGEASLFLAEELKRTPDITVVTNSLDVLESLSGRPGLKVMLTSGELHAKYHCLVGPSLGALFETLRVDKAFLAVDGISAPFGPSAADERMALAARRFANASREVIVLADHSLVGQDANHRIVSGDQVQELITDSGSLPVDRLAFASAGTAVTLADEQTTETEERPGLRPAGTFSDGKRPEAVM